jgi:peptidoglycan/LPS O-acetylase OafA/YrhL
MPVTDIRRARHAARAATAVVTRPPRFATLWAVAVTAVVGLVFTATTVLTIALWATDPAYTQTSPVVDLAFFALGGILVTVGFASQIPARQVAGLQQALLALLALAVTGLLAGRIEPFIGALLVLVAAAPLVVLHPARRQLLAARDAVSWPLAALGAVAVIPAVAYAAAMLDRAPAENR